jgi:hypothetical protein
VFETMHSKTKAAAARQSATPPTKVPILIRIRDIYKLTEEAVYTQ